MLTRKGLIALADGIVRASIDTDTDPHDLAKPIVSNLRAAGVVTSGFDQERFDTHIDNQWAKWAFPTKEA